WVRPVVAPRWEPWAGPPVRERVRPAEPVPWALRGPWEPWEARPARVVPRAVALPWGPWGEPVVVPVPWGPWGGRPVWAAPQAAEPRWAPWAPWVERREPPEERVVAESRRYPKEST